MTKVFGKRKAEMLALLKDAGYICYDCAHALGGKMVGANTMHAGWCDVCKNPGTLAAVTDYRWPKRVGIRYVFD